ncbi:hypothetical protein ACIBLA_12775 [Streptomyces sp. NPDC050433]|uniref:hypothetical protein n=1 Tax=unclassified Streptomyces TaxID=2593676 RepID=UPI003421D45E
MTDRHAGRSQTARTRLPPGSGRISTRALRAVRGGVGLVVYFDTGRAAPSAGPGRTTTRREVIRPQCD